MIQRLSQLSFRHPSRTLAVWLVGVAALTAAAGVLGTHFSGSGRLPGTDSDAAYRLLARELPDSASDSAGIVVHRAGGLEPVRPTIDRLLSSIRASARGGAVSGPTMSADGTTALYSVDLPPIERLGRDGTPVAVTRAGEFERAAHAARAAGLRVEFAGPWFLHGDVPASAEQIGLVVAVVVLCLVFGSLLAAGVTLVPALVGVAGSVALTALISHLIATPDVTTEVATMIGLGVGIDYGLFLITRFRRELASGRTPELALATTMSTAGRAVLLAGGTVAVSLLGMLLVGLDFLHGLSIGGAVAVAVAVLGSVTLLPALLRLSATSMTRHAVHRAQRPHADAGWRRWGTAIAHRPGRALIAGLGALVVLSIPALSMRLASADPGNDPGGSTTRRAFDLTAAAFGPGANGPILVVVDHATDATVATVHDALGATRGVAVVGPAVTGRSGRVRVLTVFPTSAPQSAATETLVERLRTEVLPATGATAHVGGPTASDIDFSRTLRERLPVFIGGVLACSFLLLLVVFRSILVPLKAVVLNLLSIGAAFGAMVAVFQWGWFGSVLGLDGGAPIEPWAPMLLFAIVFGLSMDYEVFLLSAIKESYDLTGDNRAAVVEGMASTGRVITAAAAIMVAVFGAFLSADLRAVQLIGFGLAVAVLVDATIVRMLLVPATMELLGARNWWLPGFLASRLPEVRLEATTDDDVDDGGREGRDLELASAGR